MSCKSNILRVCPCPPRGFETYWWIFKNLWQFSFLQVKKKLKGQLCILWFKTRVCFKTQSCFKTQTKVTMIKLVLILSAISLFKCQAILNAFRILIWRYGKYISKECALTVSTRINRRCPTLQFLKPRLQIGMFVTILRSHAENCRNII